MKLEGWDDMRWRSSDAPPGQLEVAQRSGVRRVVLLRYRGQLSAAEFTDELSFLLFAPFITLTPLPLALIH
jgi:hypothetical protein